MRSLNLPNADAAEVPENKIVGYLFSTTHAKDHPVLKTVETAFGKRYIVAGTLLAPDGTVLNVRSVWFITTETTIPRFATAHPLKRTSR